MRRLGVLMTSPRTTRKGRNTSHRSSKGFTIWVGPKAATFRIEYRWAGTDVDRIRGAAGELLDLRPDAILAMTPLAVAPLRQMTATVPIVFVQVTDPVASGIVATLARPGGNVTGFAAIEYAVGGKSLELLKQVAPAVSRVAVLYNPVQVTQKGLLANIETAAPSLGVQVIAAGRACRRRQACH